MKTLDDKHMVSLLWVALVQTNLTTFFDQLFLYTLNTSGLFNVCLSLTYETKSNGRGSTKSRTPVADYSQII